MTARLALALVTAALLCACVTVSPGETTRPSLTGTLAVPTPTSTPELTEAPTETPTAPPTPRRTLAPGETPQPSPMDISAFLTAKLGVINLTESPITVSVDIYNEGASAGTVADEELEAYGSLFQSVLEASYAVSFDRGDGVPVTCVIALATGEEIDFTLVGSDVLVTKASQPPTSGTDLFVATSPLCGPA